MNDLLIIGGGPAALAAAVYAESKSLEVAMVYEQIGGKTAWYRPWRAADGARPPAGKDVVDLLAAQVGERRVPAVNDRVETLAARDDLFYATTRHHGQIASRAVLVATGANPKRLAVPGIQHLLGQGLGYSLTTYAHQVAGGRARVAVVGVTPRTVRGIAEIIDSAEHIYLITEDAALPDLPLLAALRESPRLEVMTGTVVRDVIGFSGVKSMLIKRAGTIESLPVDRVFIDLGLTPNTQFLDRLPVTDRDGFVVVDDFNATAVEGLFAAGDVTASVFGEQALIAVGDGVRAATSAYEYLLVRRLEERSSPRIAR